MDQAEKFFVFYPIYIDSKVSLRDGRKYSKESAVTKPTFREIKQSLDALGIPYVEEAKKRHPKDIENQGRFKIKNEKGRKIISQEIANKIRDIRSKSEANSKGTNNFLNLVPKSKKKSKKN